MIEAETGDLKLNPGASPAAIEEAAAALDFRFPQDYVDFMMRSNGAGGDLGEAWLLLYKVEQLVELNGSRWPDRLILFGSDGGGEAYTFDRSKEPPRVIQLPFVSIDPEDEIDRGGSFTEFLRRVRIEGVLP